MTRINRLCQLQFACLALTLSACTSELHDAKNCYSPRQNAETALDNGVTGCSCATDDDAQCVSTVGHGAVAFFCVDGHWQSGFDGPCQTHDKSCYSPTQHLERAYEDGAQGCACDEGDPDQCIEGVALVCSDGFWRSVEDGPCAPVPPVECYSPASPDIAKEPGTSGCPCAAGDSDVCISGVALVCQDGSWRSVEDGPCSPEALFPPCAPGYSRPHPADSTCVAQKYTRDACTAAHGIPIADPGDGSLLRSGCPQHAETLGLIDADWEEGGLCCKQTTASCAPQKAHWKGLCPGAAFFYWQGNGCVPQTGCTCDGADCSARFLNEAACLAAFAQCPPPKACGARAGDTCSVNDYCAYQPEANCGGADAESICAPRPAACDDISTLVCGCDGRTYANECEANHAGTGILSFGSCIQN